jgi:hypothetical protein
MSFLSSLLEVPKVEVKVQQWPLDRTLLKFGKERWTLQDAMTGLLVVGETGSGKSSGPARTFARKFLEAGLGGLVLCFKEDERPAWVKWMKDAGREGDALVFGIDSPHRFNFLDFESKHKSSGLDHIDNLSNLLLDIAVPRKTTPIGNDASWFTPQKKLLIRNSLSLLLLADVPLTIGAMAELLQSQANTPEETKHPEWRQTSYLFDTLRRANDLNGDHPEFRAVEHYWLFTRPRIDAKNRGPLDAEFVGMVDGPLSRGKLSELFGTTTNVDPTQCFDGKVLIIDVSVEEYKEAGQHAALIWLTAFYRATMRRTYRPPESRPVFLFVDEAQAFSTEYDSEYHAACRSKGVCCVRLTQNIPGFVKAYGGGTQAQLTVDSILGNLVTKAFMKNGDPMTNEWASKVIAKETIYKTSISKTGQSPISTSVSQIEEPSCSPKEFLGLKNGGPRNKYVVESIVFQSGRPLNGERWIKANFSQK